MSFAKWFSALKNRSFPRAKVYRRGNKPLSRFAPQLILLEDRCLPAGFIPMLPSAGTVQDQGLSAVVYAPELDSNFNQANLPEAKLVTIMNNGSNVIFPIFQGTNTTPDFTAGTVTRALIEAGGAGYSGTYEVIFSLGSGPNPVQATAIAEGNGALYSITLLNPGSGYLPGDNGHVTATITPAAGNPNIPTTPAVVTAHVSNLTLAENGTKSLYDPEDELTNTYRGYIGEQVNGKYQLGLQPGHQVTVQVPIAFWDGGRIYMVDNGSVPLSSEFDPGFPLQPTHEWSYNPKKEPDNLAKLGAGYSFIVAPTSPSDKPFYGANFADPTTGYANPNGVVMWYHEHAYPGVVGKEAAHGFGFGVPAVLTEATFRDPKQPFIAPNMRPDQIFFIDNYDVSYVDSLAMPASMEATQVPSTPATPGASQYAWLGSDLSTTQMQQAIAGFTAQNTSVNSQNPGNPNGLGTYFGGLGWDQFYMPPDNNSTASGTIIQINNPSSPKNDIPVTIITASVAGLVNGGAVTLSGVKGPPGQPDINGTYIIGNIFVGDSTNGTPASFALAGLGGNGQTYTGGKWTAFKTTGVHLQKLPAGYDSISESAKLNVPSQFDATKYSLVSGGDVVSADTLSTGVATVNTNAITGVSTKMARQLVAGMLLAPAAPAGSSTNLFPNGTTILRIQLGTAGNNDTTLIMNKNATNSGSPGFAGVGGSFLFYGSKFVSKQGSIAGNDNKITGLDPKVGMYLSPGMLVTGGASSGLLTSSNTYIKSVSPDFTTITLTQNGTPTGGSGSYTFVAAPQSYVLQALINNWYAWADYYVAQLASGPNAASSGSFTAKTRQNAGRTDINSLYLDITDANFDMNLLRVGDVVTSALTPNASGTPTTPGFDPSLNYTIVSFNQDPDPTKRWVQLSLPVQTTSVVPDTFTFTPPQYIVRSSDAPAAAPKAISNIGTTSGQPFTINTATTAGLVNGMEVTVSGVTDQATNLPAAINGRWIIANVTANSFQLQDAGNANGQTLSGGIWSTSAGTIPYSLDFTPPNSADALQFAQTVYDVMQTMSLLVDPTTQASRSASLLGYLIGGNTGSFVINQAFEPITHRDTILPNERTARQLRDEIKSVLRGVYDFNKVSDQSQWYPNPATPTANATLNGSPVTFGIYNLDPYVWFVHDVLHNSSYGFSFDDDVANAQAASSTLQIAVGGNAYTAPLPQNPNVLPNPEAFSPSAPWGTQQSEGYIDTTSPPAVHNLTVGQVTISGLSQAAVARLVASDPIKDRPGAFITSDSNGLIPTGATIVLTNALPSVTQSITGIANPSGGTITITTANLSGLYAGSLVTISGVNGQSSINGRGIVTNIVEANSSFDLIGITGDGVASNAGSWTWNPSFVTFLKPDNYSPPTDNAKHQFTFSVFRGTNVPANITSNMPQATPGSVVTVNGTGLTGVFGVSFNGYGGTLVGGAIASITNDTGNPIKVVVADTTGLSEGDTVTISDVFDETTGAAAAINGRSFVIAHLVKSQENVPGSFELTGQNSTGDGHTLVRGSWIAGTDTAVKVIVPSFIPNGNGTTYPGPTGKIGVRNQSGTNYSSDNFTIVGPTLSYGPIDFQTIESGPGLGSQWIEPLGGFVVRNDRLETRGGAFNVALVNLAIPAADVFVEAKVNVAALNQYAGLLARYNGPGDTNAYLGALHRVAGGTIASIWRNVAGTWTQLSSVNLGATAGGVLRFEVVGNSLKLLLNGNLATFAFDNTITVPGLVGVRGSAQSAFDDFHANALNPIATPLSYGPINFQTQEAGPQLSEQWIEAVGNFAVQANRLQGDIRSTFNVALVNLAIPAADVFVEAKIDALALNQYAGLLARYNGSGDTNAYLGALHRVAGGTVASIWRNVAGTWTLLSSVNLGATTGGLLRFEVVGTSLKLLLNGNLATFAFDDKITAPGLVGVRGSALATFDDFRADAFNSIITPLPNGPIDFQTQEAGPQLSERWIEVVGNLAVQNNQLKGGSPLNVAALKLAVPATNGFVQATVTANAINDHVGLLARYGGPGDTNTYYAALSNLGGNNNIASIWQNVAGTWTRLKSVNVGSLKTGLLRFELSGTTLTLKFNNDPAFTISVIDNSLTSGTFGVRGTQNATWDDFSAG